MNQDDGLGLLLLMGVAGSGKTTLGKMLAGQLNWIYMDADDLHPVSNIEKVRRGIALTDEDRWPWLIATVNWLMEREHAQESGIVSCSALKRSYRDFIRFRSPTTKFIYLKADINIVARRLRLRSHHFFPTTLLGQQFALLEEPEADEAVMILDASRPAEEITSHVVERIRAKNQAVVEPGSGKTSLLDSFHAGRG